MDGVTFHAESSAQLLNTVEHTQQSVSIQAHTHQTHPPSLSLSLSADYTFSGDSLSDGESSTVKEVSATPDSLFVFTQASLLSFRRILFRWVGKDTEMLKHSLISTQKGHLSQWRRV